MIIGHQSLRDALAFVIAAAWTDRVHVAPIVFGLRMDVRVAVDLGSRRLKDSRAHPLCQPEHIHSAITLVLTVLTGLY